MDRSTRHLSVFLFELCAEFHAIACVVAVAVLRKRVRRPRDARNRRARQIDMYTACLRFAFVAAYIFSPAGLRTILRAETAVVAAAEAAGTAGAVESGVGRKR